MCIRDRAIQFAVIDVTGAKEPLTFLKVDGKDAAAADAEVATAVALLLGTEAGNASDLTDRASVIGIVGDSRAPLLGSLQIAVPALLAGSVVVIKPNPETPSAIFALAELTGRCNFPGGVFSILHGDEAAVEGLRDADGVRLFFS